MRFSFLLLLMAAAACCAPNSLKEPQPEECDSPDAITKEEVDAEMKDYVNPWTVANVTNCQVICDDDHPVIVYIDNKKEMQFTLGKMECKGGMWHVADHNASIATTRVCCKGTSYKEKNPDVCVGFGEITEAALDKVSNGQKYVRSPVEVVNGTVICSDDTPVIAYIDNKREMQFTDEMVCKAGKWHVTGNEDGIKETNVCCMGDAVATVENPKIL